MNNLYFELPQSYVNESRKGVHEIVDLQRLDGVPITEDLALNDEFNRLLLLVKSKAMQAEGDVDDARFGVMRIQHQSEPGVVHHDGFRIIDEKALLADQLDSIDLVSVFLVESATKKGELIPIVIPHNGSTIGQEIKRLVDECFMKSHGKIPAMLIKTVTQDPTAKTTTGNSNDLMRKIASLSKNVVAFGVIGTIVWGGVSMAVSKFNNFTDKWHIDNINGSINTVFSLKQWKDPRLKAQMFANTINAEHYYDLFSVAGDKSLRLKSAEALSLLVQLEKESTRNTIKDRTGGDNIFFGDREGKLSWIRTKLAERIAEEKDPQVRVAFTKIFNDTLDKK